MKSLQFYACKCSTSQSSSDFGSTFRLKFTCLWHLYQTQKAAAILAWILAVGDLNASIGSISMVGMIPMARVTSITPGRGNTWEQSSHGIREFESLTLDS